MNKYFTAISAILMVFLFSGCLSDKHIPYVNEQYTDFRGATKSLVLDLHDEISTIIPKSKNLIYVSDFVNIQNLNVTSQLGLFLASEVKSHVTEHFNVKIKEITYSKYFKLNDNGNKILSRNTNDIITLEEDKTYILVGTYAKTSKQLMMYLKLIDMKNGEILKSSSVSLPINDEIKELENSGFNQLRQNLRPHVVL